MTKVYEKMAIIAGRGELPRLWIKCAREAGVKEIVVIALNNITEPEIEELADTTVWFGIGQLRKMLKYLKKAEVHQAVMLGQIPPSILFMIMKFRPDFKILGIFWKLRNQPKNAETIFGTIADIFTEYGIEIVDSIIYMDRYLSKPGIMGTVKPNKKVQRDIDFGLKIATESSRLDIGQTVVVKNGTVLAVEGFEGTDRCIKRGGELGRKNAVVVKVAKPNHDLRYDVPCIGLRTVESLKEGKIRAIAIQVGKAIFVDYEKTIAALDKAKIAVIGVELNDER